MKVGNSHKRYKNSISEDTKQQQQQKQQQHYNRELKQPQQQQIKLQNQKQNNEQLHQYKQQQQQQQHQNQQQEQKQQQHQQDLKKQQYTKQIQQQQPQLNEQQHNPTQLNTSHLNNKPQYQPHNYGKEVHADLQRQKYESFQSTYERLNQQHLKSIQNNKSIMKQQNIGVNNVNKAAMYENSENSEIHSNERTQYVNKQQHFNQDANYQEYRQKQYARNQMINQQQLSQQKSPHNMNIDTAVSQENIGHITYAGEQSINNNGELNPKQNIGRRETFIQSSVPSIATYRQENNKQTSMNASNIVDDQQTMGFSMENHSCNDEFEADGVDCYYVSDGSGVEQSLTKDDRNASEHAMNRAGGFNNDSDAIKDRNSEYDNEDMDVELDNDDEEDVENEASDEPAEVNGIQHDSGYSNGNNNQGMMRTADESVENPAVAPTNGQLRLTVYDEQTSEYRQLTGEDMRNVTLHEIMRLWKYLTGKK